MSAEDVRDLAVHCVKGVATFVLELVRRRDNADVNID
jgi:hypothetical protein